MTPVTRHNTMKPYLMEGYVMGSIHLQGGRWFISIKGVRLWKDCDSFQPFFSEARARKYLAIAQQQIDSGTFRSENWLPDSPVLVKNVVDGWLERKKAFAKTIRDYRGAFKNHIIPAIGNKDVRKLTAGVLDDLYSHLLTYLSVKSAYNVMGALKVMLYDLWRREEIDRVPPFPRLRNPVFSKAVQYLTLEQQERILDAIPERDRPIFAFGMEYGLRTQEVRALQWSDLENGKVVIRRAFSENRLSTTKTSTERTVGDVTEYASGILDMVLSYPVVSPLWVFVRSDGKPYTNKNLNAIWHAAELATSLQCKLQNAMRHSLGCQLLDSGKPRSLVQAIYGHTSDAMTRRYARHSQPVITEALESRRKIVSLSENLVNRKSLEK